ncbi:MAG: ribbon-helix-helix domain-containing protein [Bacteroidota bacterium]
MAKDKKDLLRGRNRNILQVKADEIREEEKVTPSPTLPPKVSEKEISTAEVEEKAETKSKAKRKKKSRVQSELPKGVRRFTAYLHEDDIARLKEISSQTQIPVKDLMNEAIKDYLKSRWDEKELKEFREANARFFKYRLQ